MTIWHGLVGVSYFDCDLLALGSRPSTIYKPGIAKEIEKTIPLDWKSSAAKFKYTP